MRASERARAHKPELRSEPGSSSSQQGAPRHSARSALAGPADRQHATYMKFIYSIHITKSIQAHTCTHMHPHAHRHNNGGHFVSPREHTYQKRQHQGGKGAQGSQNSGGVDVDDGPLATTKWGGGRRSSSELQVKIGSCRHAANNNKNEASPEASTADAPPPLPSAWRSPRCSHWQGGWGRRSGRAPRGGCPAAWSAPAQYRHSDIVKTTQALHAFRT